MNKNLKEMIALPIGLRPVIRFDSNILYGSNLLNKSFIKALSKSSRTKKSSKQLETLVKNKTIIPCFLSKGFQGFVAWRIFKSRPMTMKTYDERGKEITITIDPTKAAHSIMGFYAPDNKKVVVIVSNSANIFMYASNDFLSKLVLHELMHMTALQNPSKFISIFSNDLISYYSYLWSRIFSLQKDKLKKNDITNILNLLLKFERQKSQISNSDLMEYYKLMENLKKYSTVSEEDFKKQLTDYIVIIKFFLKNISLFFSKIKKYEHIISPVYLAYKSTFGMTNLSTACIQELIYPSEIIAIYSESGPSSKFNTAVNSL